MPKKTKFDQIVITPMRGVKIPTTGKLISVDATGIVVEAEMKKGRGKAAVISTTTVQIPHSSYACFQSVDTDEAAPAEEKPARRARKVKDAAEKPARKGRKVKDAEEKPARKGRKAKKEKPVRRARKVKDDAEVKPGKRVKKVKKEAAEEKPPRKKKAVEKKLSKKERRLLKKKNKKGKGSAISSLLMDGELE